MKKIYIVLLLLIQTLFSKAEEIKSVTLITSGQGKTQDEAKQNALRNAIEQTFGAFISSHTEIVNDNVVKDEIISVSNGNIEKYEILAEEKLPNGYYSSTLSVSISTINLKSYFLNKGFEIEFDGNTFAANLKLMNQNKKNEEKLIDEIINQLVSISKKPYKFQIKAKDPIKQYNSEMFDVELEINAILSDSVFYEILKILRNTLKAISITSNDYQFYTKTNLEIFEVFWNDEINVDRFYLRSKLSRQKIINFLTCYIPSKSLMFNLDNNLHPTNGSELRRIESTNSSYKKFIKSEKLNFIIENSGKAYNIGQNPNYCLVQDLNDAQNQKVIRFDFNAINNNYVKFNITHVVTLEELEKIKKYKIEPIIEKPVIKKQINQEPIINKENTQVTENKPIFKVGDLIETVGIGDDFILGTIYQVIKIENKYFYKITDDQDKLIKKLFPEEKLRMGRG
jgi:hypothetical protein